MNNFTTFFLVLVTITILYIYLETKSLGVVYVKSNMTKETYLVRNLPDKQEASDNLALISLNLTKLLYYLLENIDSYEKEYQNGIHRLKKNYNPKNIYESSPGNKFTSYSINKGEKIIFCIREKSNNKLIDRNTMMFVAIHEFAHLMSKSIGHTPEFWKNMKFLLKCGIKCNIYKYVDYGVNPKPYCGMQITDTPLSHYEIET